MVVCVCDAILEMHKVRRPVMKTFFYYGSRHNLHVMVKTRQVLTLQIIRIKLANNVLEFVTFVYSNTGTLDI